MVVVLLVVAGGRGASFSRGPITVKQQQTIKENLGAKLWNNLGLYLEKGMNPQAQAVIR